MELAAVFRVNGIALRVIAAVFKVGVAAKIDGRAVAKLGGNVVAVFRAKIGRAGFHAVDKLLISAHVKHGRIATASIVAKNRNRMGHALSSVFGSFRFHKHKAFHVSAGGIISVQLCFLRFAEFQGDLYGNGAARTDDDAGGGFPQE